MFSSFKKSIKLKLFLSVWIITGTATLIFTSLQIYSEYLNDRQDTLKQFSTIKGSYLDSLSNSLWELDLNAVRLQLKGISQLKDILYVELVENNQTLYKFGTASQRPENRRIFDLLNSNNKVKIGKLILEVDLEGIKKRYLRKSLSIFIGQAVKSFAVSALLLLVFQRLITNHLLSISNYLKNIDLKEEKPRPHLLETQRTFDSNDEIDLIVEQINNMVDEVYSNKKELQNINLELENRVEKRTNELQQNLTNLKEMQDKLIIQEKFASIGALTAGIAHEIKNPLNLISNSAVVLNNLLKEDFKDLKNEPTQDQWNEFEKDMSKVSEIIKNNSQRADIIIKNMLIQSSSRLSEKKPISIAEYLVENYKLSFYSHKARAPLQIREVFNIEFTGEVKVFVSDLGRAFINIFDNAFYALKEQKINKGDSFMPQINIEVYEESKSFVIKIKDNGKGIPKEKIDKVIDPFFTTKPIGHGTGLGLSMVNEIIKKHNGILSINSKYGEYTEITMKIPKAA